MEKTEFSGLQIDRPLPAAAPQNLQREPTAAQNGSPSRRKPELLQTDDSEDMSDTGEGVEHCVDRLA